ncbi:hypothetical protein [Paenibacillus harenae]|uniref:hypothetical protein n=1 Tax=Paenibacillus harenae TaxID=306543 RepID=UPI0003FCDF6F|nr:hypothetical protein [Paenibacillus harenae]
MNKQPSASEQGSFIFNIEVLVEGNNNAAALEKLLSTLNKSHFTDYRILSGIRLGEEIDERKARAAALDEIPVTQETGIQANLAADNKNTQAAPPASEAYSGFDKLKDIMKNNTLIRLIVNKGLGIKLNIPCRVINMDEKENLITVYHVDEKQVYSFRLNEIEDFSS